jgi:hypothetical protein
MRKIRGVPISVSAALVLTLLPAALPASAAADTGLEHRSCGISPELSTIGVRCDPAERIAKKAIDKSNCPYSPSFQGCNRTVTVGGKWTCRGLFPGEGWTFTCSAGDRRIHYSGGG